MLELLFSFPGFIFDRYYSYCLVDNRRVCVLESAILMTPSFNMS